MPLNVPLHSFTQIRSTELWIGIDVYYSLVILFNIDYQEWINILCALADISIKNKIMIPLLYSLRNSFHKLLISGMAAFFKLSSDVLTMLCIFKDGGG